MAWVNLLDQLNSRDTHIEGAAASYYGGPVSYGVMETPFTTSPILSINTGCGDAPFIYYVGAGDTVDHYNFGGSPYTAPDSPVILVKNVQSYASNTPRIAVFIRAQDLQGVGALRAKLTLRGDVSNPRHAYLPIKWVDLDGGTQWNGEVLGAIEHPSYFDNETDTNWTTVDVSDPPSGGDVFLSFIVERGGCSGSFGPFALHIEVEQPDELLAVDDEATTPHATPVTLDILANDTLNGEPVQLSDLAGPPEIVALPSVGSAVANPDGTITYTPPEGFTGEVEFQYRIALPEPPEPPEPEFMCIVPGEGFLIVSMPGDFDTGDYVELETQDGRWMQLHFASWSGGWVHAQGDYIYPQPGDTYTLSQGNTTIEVTDVRNGYIIEHQGGDFWFFGQGYYPPNGANIQVATEDDVFSGSMGQYGRIHWSNNIPPTPTSGTSYPVVVSSLGAFSLGAETSYPNASPPGPDPQGDCGVVAAVSD